MKSNKKQNINKSVILQKKSFGTMFNRSKKGFGGAASALILFIAILTISTALVITFQNFAVDTNSALKKQNDLTVNKIKTSLDITHVFYDDTLQVLYIYVKNIGSTDLVGGNFDVFVDSYFEHNVTAVLADDQVTVAEVVKPQDSILFKFNIVLPAGTHKSRVVSEFGVGDEEDFNVS